MSDLRTAAHPQDLVPGVPEDCETLATRLATYSDDARASAARLDAIDSEAWVGAAGDAFRKAIGELPLKLRRASDAFWDAANALRIYAGRLREAQAAAARAIELFAEADARSGSWAGQQQAYDDALRLSSASESPPPDSPPPTADPGEDLRHEGERILDQARRDVDEAARRASDLLKEAGRAAPNKPGWLKRALSGAADFAGGFVGGVVEGTTGMVTFGFKLTPAYALIDPEGYVENLTGMATGIAYGVTHPVDFAKAAANWDMWLNDPGRALGQLVPELILSAATAGVGGAAAKGSGAARRLAGSADELRDVGRAARKADDLKQVDRLSAAADRSVDINRITPKPVWRTTDEPLFRLDNRPPETIFQEGFRPRGAGGDLVEFTQQNTDSMFVSTSVADDLFRHKDWADRRFQYRIDAPGGVDVNATLRPADNLFSHEREIAFPGGVETGHVEGAWELVADGSGGTTRGQWVPNPNYTPHNP